MFEAGRVDHLPEAKGALDCLFQVFSLLPSCLSLPERRSFYFGSFLLLFLFVA